MPHCVALLLLIVSCFQHLSLPSKGDQHARKVSNSEYNVTLGSLSRAVRECQYGEHVTSDWKAKQVRQLCVSVLGWRQRI